MHAPCPLLSPPLIQQRVDGCLHSFVVPVWVPPPFLIWQARRKKTEERNRAIEAGEVKFVDPRAARLAELEAKAKPKPGARRHSNRFPPQAILASVASWDGV